MKIKSLAVVITLILNLSMCSYSLASYQVNKTEQFTIINESNYSFGRSIDKSTIKIPIIVNSLKDGISPYFQVKRMSIYPNPDDIQVDDKGNALAIYKDRNRNKNSLKVIQMALIESKQVKLVPQSYKPSDKFDKYLAPSRLTESDAPQIVAKAKELTGNITDPYLKAKKIFEYVQNHMSYVADDKYANKGALSALINGKGVCEDHASLMVALLRASKVPARMASGWAFDFDFKNVSNKKDWILPDGSVWLQKTDDLGSINMQGHAWVEFYVEGEGWVPTDAVTSLPKSKIPLWENFGSLNEDWNYFVEYYDDKDMGGIEWSYDDAGESSIKETGLLEVAKGFKNVPNDYVDLFGLSRNSNDPIVTPQSGTTNNPYSSTVPANGSSQAEINSDKSGSSGSSERNKQNEMFIDVSDTFWAKDAIQYLVSKQLLSGYSDYSFRPNNNISRAEFTVLLCKALGIKPVKDIPIFTDTTNHWAQGYISAVKKVSLINGYDGNTFAPDNPITRAEVAVIITKALNLSQAEPKSIPKDVQTHWAKEQILKVIGQGIMKGYNDGSFNPDEELSRAEGAVVILKVMEVLKRT